MHRTQIQMTAVQGAIAALIALITGGNASIALAQTSPTENVSSPSCVVGYPEAPVPGDRTISRYEFAVTLNQCLNNLEEQLGLELENAVPRSEVEATTQRQQGLNTELEDIGDRLDELSGSPASSPASSSSTSEGQADRDL